MDVADDLCVGEEEEVRQAVAALQREADVELDIDTRHALGTPSYDVRVGAYDVRVDRLGDRGTATFRRDNLRLPRSTFARLD